MRSITGFASRGREQRIRANVLDLQRLRSGAVPPGSGLATSAMDRPRARVS